MESLAAGPRFFLEGSIGMEVPVQAFIIFNHGMSLP
jgi:hypothetical protein